MIARTIYAMNMVDSCHVKEIVKAATLDRYVQSEMMYDSGEFVLLTEQLTGTVVKSVRKRYYVKPLSVLRCNTPEHRYIIPCVQSD